LPEHVAEPLNDLPPELEGGPPRAQALAGEGLHCSFEPDRHHNQAGALEPKTAGQRRPDSAVAAKEIPFLGRGAEGQASEASQLLQEKGRLKVGFDLPEKPGQMQPHS
jgi:hypothetical protein